MPITTCVFDAYGTLFDVAAAARAAAAEPGQRPACRALAEARRRLAAEAAGIHLAARHHRRHADFWQVTKDGLDWALEAAGLDDDATARPAAGALLASCDAYPEVPEMLAALKARGIGHRDPVERLARDAGRRGAPRPAIGDLLDAVLSVESVGIFKPAAAVYDLVAGTVRLRPRRRAVRVLQRLGRRGRRGLRLHHRLGQPRRRSDGPALCAAAARCCPISRRSPTSRWHLMPRFHHRRRRAPAYTDEGSGLPLIALAGLTRNGARFRLSSRRICSGVRLIRPDYRGRGQSDWADPATYTIPQEARDVRGADGPSGARAGPRSSAPRAAG